MEIKKEFRRLNHPATIELTVIFLLGALLFVLAMPLLGHTDKVGTSNLNAINPEKPGAEK